MSAGSYKNVSTEWINISYIFYIYVKTGFGIKKPTMVDMP